MFAIDLTYRQVLDIARKMSEAENRKEVDAYFSGVYDTCYDFLSEFYSDDEITELVEESGGRRE